MNWLKEKVSQAVSKVTDMAEESIVANKVNEVKLILDRIATNDSLSEEMKVRWIIRGGSLFCALVAAQPVPFADVLLLTPIQVTMVYYLAKSMNITMSENGAKELVVYIAGVMGFGVMAQHTILGLYKAGLPFLGGVTTVPLVFIATYGMGVAAHTVLQAKQEQKTLSDEKVKSIYKQATEKIKEEVKATSVSEFKAELEQLKNIAKEKDVCIAEQQQTIQGLNNRITNVEKQYEQELGKWIRQAEKGRADIFRNEDIRGRFLRLFAEAKTEILIVSPWISRKVMSKLRDQMTATLRRGVKIKILYGINDNAHSGSKGDESDLVAKEILEQWFGSFVHSGMLDIRRGNTHEKVVCCDDVICLLGSYNYLSFGGQYDARTRAEVAVLIHEPIAVKKYCDEFRRVFKSANQPRL